MPDSYQLTGASIVLSKFFLDKDFFAVIESTAIEERDIFFASKWYRFHIDFKTERFG